MDITFTGNMTHDTLNSTLCLKSTINDWNEADFQFFYEIKEKSRIHLGLTIIYDSILKFTGYPKKLDHCSKGQFWDTLYFKIKIT